MTAKKIHLKLNKRYQSEENTTHIDLTNCVNQPNQNNPIHLPSFKFTLPHGASWISVAETLPEVIQMDEIIFERIWNLHPIEYASGLMFGNHTVFKRWDQSYGLDYWYAGKLHKGQPIEDPFLQSLLQWVCDHSGKEYFAMLINWYENGNHYIGYHSDFEKSIVPNSSIYSFSYGQERDFLIKSKDKTYKQKIQMKNGSLIIMGGEMQKYYKHSVPKRALSKCPRRRINITLRLFKTE